MLPVKKLASAKKLVLSSLVTSLSSNSNLASYLPQNKLFCQIKKLAYHITAYGSVLTFMCFKYCYEHNTIQPVY